MLSKMEKNKMVYKILFHFFFVKLFTVKFLIISRLGNQFIVGASLYDLAFFKNDDLIGILCRRDTVAYQNGRFVCCDTFKIG